MTKICAVCEQTIREGEAHSRMGIGVGVGGYRHGHVVGDLRPCVHAALARAEDAEGRAMNLAFRVAELELAYATKPVVFIRGRYYRVTLEPAPPGEEVP